LLAPRPTPRLEERPMSAVHYCLFNIIAAVLHTGGNSNPQPKDAPCRGDRGTTVSFSRRSLLHGV